MDTNHTLSTLEENWLDLALTHVVTQWLRRSLWDLLPSLLANEISSEVFAAEIDAVLQSRNLFTLSQQKNPRSNVAQALKSICPDHRAIALVSLAPAQYRVLNDEQLGKLGDTKPKYITSETAQLVVARATDLLSSAEWSDVSAGLAVLVGRRISEILLSNFAPKSTYSILFSGLAKKSSASATIAIEIPTLASAEAVLAAINRLQTGLKIEDLKLESLSEKQARQIVNRRYSEASAEACDHHFADLVPKRQDKERLYNHLFRALYATIAAHWYCPSTVLEHNYKAEIQGHFTVSTDGKKVPNYSARSHYDDYLIGYFDCETQTMQRDGRLGLKLGLEGVEGIEVFRKGQNDLTNLPKGDRTHSSASLSAPAEIEGEIMSKAQSSLSQDLNQQTTQDAKVSDVMTGRSTKLRKVKSDLKSADISPQLSTTTETPALNTTGSEPKSASTRKQQNSSHSKKAQTKRPDLEADDLERVRSLMAHFGIVGSYTQVFSALLDRFEQLQQLQQQPSPHHQDLETIRWFTREIDALRSQVIAIEQEKDQLKVSCAKLEEIAQLSAENALLKSQLQQNQAVLDNLRSSLAQVGLVGTGEALTSPPNAATEPTAVSTAQSPPRLTHTSVATKAPTTIHPYTDQPLATTNGAIVLGAETEVKASPSSPSSPSTPSKTPKKTRSGAQQTAAKIHQILDALIAWNHQNTHPNQRIRIGILPVKALASKMGADYQAQIQAALQQRREEIDRMHQSLLLGNKHNRTLLNKDELLQAIARDYLHMTNWQDVRYPA